MISNMSRKDQPYHDILPQRIKVQLMPAVLITGAASGIGKAFVRAYLKCPDYNIFAIDKSFQAEDEWLPTYSSSSQKDYLRDVGGTSDVVSKVRIYAIDITQEKQLLRLESLRDLDIVIHSAGVRGLKSCLPITQKV